MQNLIIIFIFFSEIENFSIIPFLIKLILWKQFFSNILKKKDFQRFKVNKIAKKNTFSKLYKNHTLET